MRAPARPAAPHLAPDAPAAFGTCRPPHSNAQARPLTNWPRSSLRSQRATPLRARNHAHPDRLIVSRCPPPAHAAPDLGSGRQSRLFVSTAASSARDGGHPKCRRVGHSAAVCVWVAIPAKGAEACQQLTIGERATLLDRDPSMMTLVLLIGTTTSWTHVRMCSSR
jgi:hypothetical protein